MDVLDHKKTISLFNLTSHRLDINNIYLYAKGLYESKRESTGLRYCKDTKAFVGYSNDMDNIYENTKEHNPNKNRKILIVFDDIIADVSSNTYFNPMVTELFIRVRKLSISFVFITQSYLLCQEILD